MLQYTKFNSEQQTPQGTDKLKQILYNHAILYTQRTIELVTQGAGITNEVNYLLTGSTNTITTAVHLSEFKILLFDF